jgi:DNA-binding MarR family transcriptional regulator
MSKRQDLEKQVIIAAREYGISSVLFRNAIGDKLGLNVTDMECLGLLFFKITCTPTGLARYTGLSTGSTTAMLDRLERAGLIRRKPNPNDRRGVLIEVEKKSVKTVGPMFAEARKAQDQLVASYSEKDLQTIANFLKRFTAVFDEEREKVINKSKSA